MFARHARFGTALLVLLLTLPLLACPQKGDRVGDANGDQRFDDLDLQALLQILTSNSTNPSPPDGPAAADVARPCGGPVDEVDMRRLRAALAIRDAADAGVEMDVRGLESHCHAGAMIGARGFNPQPEPPADPTLDGMFDLVAGLAPGFGGAYVEDGTLRVVVLALEDFEGALAALEEVFGEHLPDLPAEPALGRFGFAELQGWRAIGEELIHAPEVTSIGIDERANAIKVGLQDLADRSVIADLAAHMGLPDEALLFEQMDLAEPFAFVDDLRSTERPIRGGLQITRGTGSCTLGVPAVRGGVRGFLTNSHCTSALGMVNSDVFFQATGAPADQVGVEVADSNFWAAGCPGNLCTNADAAFIQLDPGVTGYLGGIRNTPANSTVKSESLFSFQGLHLHKTGRTTGHSTGQVTDTCSTIQLLNGNVYFCQDKVDGASNSGDSGSPVFRYANSIYNVAFHGLLWGGPQGGGDYFWFTPLALVESELGDVDPVWDNQLPEVEITSPVHGSSLGSGNTFNVTLTANYFDFESGGECNGCTVRWISPSDGGELGISSAVAGVASLPVTLFGPGGRWIYAEATDAASQVSVDAVYVVTSNSAPTVTIQEPFDGATLEAGSMVVLEGTSFDAELFSPLPCNHLQWSSAGIAGTSANGCLASVVFPNVGSYTLLLTGTDGNGGSGQDVHTVNVVPGPNTGPPQVTIVSPLVGAIELRWPTHYLMQAWGNDPDDKDPITYQWVLRAPSTQLRSDIPQQLILSQSGGVTEVQIGLDQGPDETSSNGVLWLPTQYLQSGCGSGGTFEVEIRAQDADGQPATPDTRSYEGITHPC